MADSDTRKAAIQAVKGLFDTEGVDSSLIAWENTKFNADGKDLWFRVTFMPNTPGVVTLGLGGRDRMTGFIQVDVNIPIDTNVAIHDNWFDKFRQEFFAGKTFTFGTTKLRVISTGMSGGRIFDETWFRKSVTIAFRTDLTRNSTP